MATWSLDPTSPAVADNPRGGYAAIQKVAEAVLEMLGLPSSAAFSGPVPFVEDPATGLVTVVGDPTADLGIATRQYAKSRTVYTNTVTQPSANVFQATPSPAITAYAGDVLYLLHFPSSNTGACTLNISGVGAFPITRWGGDLVGGEIQALHAIGYIEGANQFELLGQDATALPKTGGTMTGSLYLTGSPSAANEAASKAYVDGKVVGPVYYYPRVTLNNLLVLTMDAAEHTVLSTVVAIPSDGYQYRLMTSYSALVNCYPATAPHVVSTRLTDLTNTWCASGGFFSDSQSSEIRALACSGLSTPVYNSGDTVSLKLNIIGESNGHAADPLTVQAAFTAAGGGTVWADFATWLDVYAVRVQN